VFIQACLVVAVFLTAWVLLAAIRPPFTRDTTLDERHSDHRCPDTFSAGKGAAFAAGAAGLCIIGMVLVGVLGPKPKAGK
jgi:hypothetical protein